MDESRREKVKEIIDNLHEEDINYAETILKESYKSEIDRKDKILTSMTIVTTPITILFAGVAFLTNSSLDTGQKLITSNPDIIVWIFYIVAVLIIFQVGLIFYNFHKLLSGENYYYLPNADTLLDNIAKNYEYCIANNILSDGAASLYSKTDAIMQLAESSTKNCAANDIRLRYRQKIFRSTTAAIICAGIGFVVVATHRERPNIWSPIDLWKKTDGNPSATAPLPTHGPAQTKRSNDKPAAGTPPPAPSPGH